MYDKFQQIIIDYLLSKSEVKEFDLLSFLKNDHPEFFEPIGLNANLYKQHFLLFNFLYKLESLLLAKDLKLTISATSIKLRSISTKSKELGESDPIRPFYLDDKNLNLPEDEVQGMMDLFWSKYLALEEKSNALVTLNLEKCDDISMAILRKRYNQLAKIHHPDRGGDPGKFIEIKAAYDQLKLLIK